MTMDEIHYKKWRIEILHGDQGWKALIYRPGSPLHELAVPEGQDRRAVLAKAQTLIDEALR